MTSSFFAGANTLRKRNVLKQREREKKKGQRRREPERVKIARAEYICSGGRLLAGRQEVSAIRQ